MLATLKNGCPFTSPQIDLAEIAGRDHPGRPFDIQRQGQGSDQIVGGAERDDAQRQAGIEQAGPGGGQRAVAALPTITQSTVPLARRISGGISSGDAQLCRSTAIPAASSAAAACPPATLPMRLCSLTIRRPRWGRRVWGM
jgi:hypothetical protein